MQRTEGIYATVIKNQNTSKFSAQLGTQTKLVDTNSSYDRRHSPLLLKTEKSNDPCLIFHICTLIVFSVHFRQEQFLTFSLLHAVLRYMCFSGKLQMCEVAAGVHAVILDCVAL